MTEPDPTPDRWSNAWPDALAFFVGLGLAWYFHWETRDLVWSLWLSSLVIGYAMIVWSIFGVGITTAWKVMTAPAEERAIPRGEQAKVALFSGVMFLGGLFLLAFFTVHFGGFHFVHSVFLSFFFPLEPGAIRATPGLAFYGEVFQRYWWFLPSAAIAERAAFRSSPPAAQGDTAVTPAAIAARKAAAGRAGLAGGGMMAPYRNVFRLHLLIFFFAAASFARLDNFIVYAVVCAVYFFPWRFLKRATPV